MRTGSDDIHGAAAGPMSPVVHNLATVPEEDVRAIADYIASFTARVPPERQRSAQALLARVRSGTATWAGLQRDAGAAQPGAAVYAGACSVCHDVPRRHGLFRRSAEPRAQYRDCRTNAAQPHQCRPLGHRAGRGRAWPVDAGVRRRAHGRTSNRTGELPAPVHGGRAALEQCCRRSQESAARRARILCETLRRAAG